MEQVEKATINKTMYWWLSKNRPFFIGDEYKIELVAIDFKHHTVKVNITNLKTNEVSETEESLQV